MMLSPLLVGALLAGPQDERSREPQPIPAFTPDIKTEAPAERRAQGDSPDGFRRASVAPAQAPAGLADPARSISTDSLRNRMRDHVYFDNPRGLEWWARGRSYKARFGVDSVDYIPFLGSQAPQNYPVRLRLAAAYADSEPVALDRTARAVLSDHVISYERGAVTERYLLGPDSVEQTFVFHERTNAALRVEVEIETELEATLQDSVEGLRLSNSLGGVQLSRAFAVDALGRRIEIPTEFQGDSYAITVPPAFVAASEFPITIDPVITTLAIDDIFVALTDPKTAYDPGTDSYLVVYSENFSAFDGDVYSAEVRADGTTGLLGYVDLTSERWFSPDVGAAREDGVMLVAAATESGTPTIYAVEGRTFLPQTETYGPVFRIDEVSNNCPKTDVSVGGDPIDRFLVVWKRVFGVNDGDIHARVVLSDGSTPIPGNLLLDNSTIDYSMPHCSKHNRTTNPGSSAWSIVARRQEGALSRIWAAQILWNGFIAEEFFPVTVSAADDSAPRVSSPLEETGQTTCVVTWERDFGSDRDIFAAALFGSSVSAVTVLSFQGLAGASGFDDETMPVIDSDGQRFALAWRDNGSITYASTLELSGSTLSVIENAPVDPTGSLLPSGIAASPGPAADAPILIVSEDSSEPFSPNIAGTIYQPAETSFQSTITCTPAAVHSSGLPARIEGTGSNTAGQEVTLLASQMPPVQFGFFLVSRTASSAFTPPGSQGNLCLTGDIGRFNTSILSTGPTGAFQMTIDTSILPFAANQAVLPGESLNFTAWFRDNNPGPTSNFTDVLRAGFF